MDEPSSYNFLNTISSPGLLYTLGFIFFIIIVLVAVGEVIFFQSKTSQFSPDSKRTMKQLLEQPRLYILTLLVSGVFACIFLSAIVLLFFNSLFEANTFIVVFISITVIFWGIELCKMLTKVIVMKNANQIFHVTSTILLFFSKILKPFTLSLSNFDFRLSRKINQPNQLREELHDSLERTIKPEDESEGQKEILKGIVTFSTLRVKQVMKGRTEIAAVNIGMNFHELLQKINVYGFSRIPVFKNLTDQLVGVLYSKDLLPFLEQDEKFEWQKLLRPGFFVTENKRLDSLLKDFQEKRIHIALVFNEQKRVSGIITMEDVIEEIIGDINDEFDEAPRS